METRERTKRKAIRSSIRKWVNIVKGKEIDRGGENCALCAKYLYSLGGYCFGCPVKTLSGSTCKDTPYILWIHRIYERPIPEWRKSDTARNPAERQAAKAELNFLKEVYTYAFPKRKKLKVYQQAWWMEANNGK